MLSVIQRCAIGCVFPDVSKDHSALIFIEKRSQRQTHFLTLYFHILISVHYNPLLTNRTNKITQFCSDRGNTVHSCQRPDVRFCKAM